MVAEVLPGVGTRVGDGSDGDGTTVFCATRGALPVVAWGAGCGAIAAAEYVRT